MMTDNKEIWIKIGYGIFARTGKDGLKIETLSKKVGISKSSFYHHFADLENFIDFLCEYRVKNGQKPFQMNAINPNGVAYL